MDEQINPVAWVDTDDLEYLVADGEVCADLHNSRVGECFAPLYSQQSIDALRAKVAEARDGWNVANGAAELAMKHRDEVEAEAKALRADAARYRWIRDRIAGREHIEELVEFNHDAVRRSEVDAAIDADRREAE